MTKNEFEKLAGYEVAVDDYDRIIEPMYMATDLTKEAFVTTINRKRFEVKKEESDLEKQIKLEIKELKHEIEKEEEAIQIFKSYYEEDNDEYWKEQIVWKKHIVKKLKARINSLRFVLR